MSNELLHGVLEEAK